MKLLTVIFPVSRRDKVVRALADHPVPGLSLSRVSGFGQVSDPLGLIERCQIEMVLPDDQIAPIKTLLESILSTGDPEAGILFWRSLDGYQHL